MTVITSIIDTATGRLIQKMKFGRMPRVGLSFNLESGELVTAQRVEVRKPEPGKFITPIDVFVAPPRIDRQP